MSTIKSSDEHLTLNADGSSKDIKFQANGVEKASISSAGAFTSTTIDATKLTGNLPAISGANLTGVGVAGISSSADATAMTITSAEKIGIGTGSPSVNVHIVDDASEGTPTFAGATHFAVQATASSGDNVNASLISGSAGVSRLMFGDKDDEDAGKIEYSNSTNAMAFTANGSERMSITSDGRGLSQFTAKAWVNFKGTSTVSIRDSHNVSSITDHATGTYDINFTNNMAHLNYSAVGGASHSSDNNDYVQCMGIKTLAVGFARMITAYIPETGGSHYDSYWATLTVFGD